MYFKFMEFEAWIFEYEIKNRLRAMDFSRIRYPARENVLGIDKSQSRSD